MSKPHDIETIAFAYELKCEGFTWEFIADMVGGSVDKIRWAVRKHLKLGVQRNLVMEALKWRLG